MDRRSALRAAAGMAVGLASVAACDSAPSQHTAPPAPPAGGGAPAPSGGTPAQGLDKGLLPPEVVHGPRDKPNVALTFHGQGDPAQVKALLDELEHAGARVTVLAVGSWLDAQPAMAKRVLDGGHELGNHTQNHLAVTKAFTEIDACASRLKRLTGSIGTWFRPSQTQFSTPTVRAQATKVGYPTCLSYDLDSTDSTDPGAAAVVRTTLAGVQHGSIVSLHFGHAGTVSALPEILDGLRQRGLHPVTMTELMA